MIANYMIVVAILLLILISMVPNKEGFENEDYLTLAIKSLKSARKDRRMTPYQQIALQDALNYANYIKNI